MVAAVTTDKENGVSSSIRLVEGTLKSADGKHSTPVYFSFGTSGTYGVTYYL